MHGGRWAVRAAALSAMSSAAQAVFVNLGNYAIYDEALNLTLAQDVRYDELDLLSISRVSGLYGTVVANVVRHTHVCGGKVTN